MGGGRAQGGRDRYFFFWCQKYVSMEELIMMKSTLFLFYYSKNRMKPRVDSVNFVFLAYVLMSSQSGTSLTEFTKVEL